MDPKARELMSKMIFRPNVDNEDIVTVRKKSGEEKVFKGGRVLPMSHDDLMAKYRKTADFMEIDRDQADRAIKQWMNLKDVKDIADAIATVAKFGRPKALTDKSPSRIA